MNGITTVYTEGEIKPTYVDVLPKETFGGGGVIPFRSDPGTFSKPMPFPNIFSSVKPMSGTVTLGRDGGVVINESLLPGTVSAEPGGITGGTSVQLNTERRPELVPFSPSAPTPGKVSTPEQKSDVGGFRGKDLIGGGLLLALVVLLVGLAKGAH